MVTDVSPAASGLRTVLLINGDSLSVPAAALPYVGRALDPSLFRVSLLARREADGRLPVRVAYRRGRPLLPGVSVTRAAGGVATGT